MQEHWMKCTFETLCYKARNEKTMRVCCVPWCVLSSSHPTTIIQPLQALCDVQHVTKHVSPWPSSLSTSEHNVHPLEHRQGHDLVGAESCAWCDLYTRNPYVAQLYQSFHKVYVYDPDTVNLDLHLDLHRGRAMDSWPCVFQR